MAKKLKKFLTRQMKSLSKCIGRIRKDEHHSKLKWRRFSQINELQQVNSIKKITTSLYDEQKMLQLTVLFLHPFFCSLLLPLNEIIIFPVHFTKSSPTAINITLTKSVCRTTSHVRQFHLTLHTLCTLIDGVKVLRPTRHKIGHFRDVPQASLLAW